MKVALLGSSYIAHDMHKDVACWGSHLASEFSNLDVINFGVSGCGLSYSKFILDWMVETNYSPNAIILECTSIMRKHLWIGEGSNNIADYFDFNPINNSNYYSARLTGKDWDFLTMGAQLMSNSPDSDRAIRNKKDATWIYERTILASNYEQIEWRSTVRSIEHYEKLIGCPIFVYMHDQSNHYQHDIISLINQTTATDFLHKNTNDFMFDVAHFNSHGNKYLFEHYIKPSKIIKYLQQQGIN